MPNLLKGIQYVVETNLEIEEQIGLKITENM